MRNRDSPGSAFAHSPLVVGLLVVQLVVGGVFTFGSGCDHGPGLIPIGRLGSCSAPRGWAKKRRTKRPIGYAGMGWTAENPDTHHN